MNRRSTAALGWLTLIILNACTSAEKTADAYSGHGATAVNAKAVESFAPSALPPETSTFVQRMLEITEPGSGVLAPDGKTMYLTWAVSGTRQVWKIDGPLRFRCR